jgi:hypothetical protein
MFAPGPLERIGIYKYAPGLCLDPQKESRPRNWVPRRRPAAVRPISGEPAAEARPAGSWGSIPTEVRGGGAAGGVERLRRPVPAAAPSAPASSRPVPADGQCGQHLGGLVSRFGNDSVTGKGAWGGSTRPCRGDGRSVSWLAVERLRAHGSRQPLL